MIEMSSRINIILIKNIPKDLAYWSPEIVYIYPVSDSLLYLNDSLLRELTFLVLSYLKLN